MHLAHITLDMIDGVLLVGGSTHIPLVAEIIEENFTSPSLPVHTKLPKPLIDEPDMAVGYGAAIAAASIGTQQQTKMETARGESISVTAHFAPGVGYGGISNVEGSLQAEGGKLPDGIYAKVTRAAGGFKKEYMVNEDGTFLFEELVAEEEKEPYTCTFMAGGKVLLEAGFDAAPGTITTPPVVLLSKPNSFDQNDIGSGGFGKTVTISGEILDDSDIGSLTVKVYRKKADGTEITVSDAVYLSCDVPVVDVERSGRSSGDLQRELLVFLKALEKHYGAKPVIYASAKFRKRHLDSAEFDSYPFWVAHYYVSRPDTDKLWRFWQFTDRAGVDGIDGNTDFNVFRGTEADFNKLRIEK